MGQTPAIQLFMWLVVFLQHAEWAGFPGDPWWGALLEPGVFGAFVLLLFDLCSSQLA